MKKQDKNTLRKRRTEQSSKKINSSRNLTTLFGTLKEIYQEEIKALKSNLTWWQEEAEEEEVEEEEEKEKVGEKEKEKEEEEEEEEEEVA